MFQTHIGEFAALLTAFCWTITALAFESASKKVGSLAVNLIRLIIAFFLLGLFNLITRGYFLPMDAGINVWLWLSLSGIIGLVIGDLFLFESYTLIGSRTAMLIMTLVPLITAFISWLMFGETLTWMKMAGVLLTLSGIVLVVIFKKSEVQETTPKPLVKGIIFATIGAVGQAAGLVFSKAGMKNYDAFAASHIRIMVGILGFVVIVSVMKKWKNVKTALHNPMALKRIGLGSVFGPFLGISLSLYAVQHANSGVAATLMSIVPVLIIPASVLFLHQKVSFFDILGAVISVFGVALLFL